MVLHNNKWDRKATRAYNRKHGITPQARDPKPDEESDQHEVTGSEASASESEDNSTIDNELDKSEAVTSSPTIPRRRKKLASNAWRYENLEADEELGVEDTSKQEEEAYLASIVRPADGGLSKYLVDKDAKEVHNLEAVRDIFESQLDVSEANGWAKKKNVAAEAGKGPNDGSKKSKIVTYNAADPEFRDADRRIEKLKYTDTVRERYRSANRKDAESELDRLKLLPKSVAAPLLKERRTAGLQKTSGLDEDFDSFWNEMDRKGTAGAKVGSAVADEFTSKGATVRPAMGQGWGAAPNKSRPVTASAPVRLKETNLDADDKFLDDLLSSK
ncbi:hypothetical protein V1525DRAFT_406021 [Lipomyces kononenkoae]|uniref:Uncharacterized protein n=1 Tax=Lipomyces kononenkoae TaxID=34357 RepID=A0ACC3SYH1_LIPKO